jgi:DNA-binding MarR family transcriptional regulator
MPSRKKTAAAPAPQDTATLVLRQFRQVFNAVKTHFQQVERAVGLGGAAVWALSLVRDQPGLGVGALAKAMSIHQSTASNLVRGLVERGLVATAKDDGDKRAVRLQLLPAGAKLLRAAPQPLTGLLPDALASLDAPTLERLHADLALLIVALGADEHGASVPLSDL